MSYIEARDGKITSYVGEDATRIFQAKALMMGCRMWATHKILPNRLWTPTKMLAASTNLTGKSYKRGQHAKAAEDLLEWINNAESHIEIRRS